MTAQRIRTNLDSDLELTGNDLGLTGEVIELTGEVIELTPAPRELPRLASRHLLGMRVDATSYLDAAERVIRWARAGESRYLCASSVNNVIQSLDDPSFLEVMNSSDLDTPDGMPLVWGLKMLGVEGATRTCGPLLMPLLCERAAREGIPVGFYGSAPDVLEELVTSARKRWPELDIAYHMSPPFRELTAAERAEIVEAINSSGARILFIGLGTPKQDRWMAQHRGKVNAVMLGVGAAFDFMAGRKRQAPSVVQKLGLEWLFRLLSEPRRLWKRYLCGNPRFLVLFAAQVIKHRLMQSRNEVEHITLTDDYATRKEL